MFSFRTNQCKNPSPADLPFQTNQARNRTTRTSLSPQLWQPGGKHIQSPSHHWLHVSTPPIWQPTHSLFNMATKENQLHHLFQNNQFISFNTLTRMCGVEKEHQHDQQLESSQTLTQLVKSKMNITHYNCL